MPADAQKLGDSGEAKVAQQVGLPGVSRQGLTTLGNSFPLLDLVCRECGAYLAQAKVIDLPASDPARRPKTIRTAGV